LQTVTELHAINVSNGYSFCPLDNAVAATKLRCS